MAAERNACADAGRFLRPLLGAVEADVELEFIPPICLACRMPCYSECPRCEALVVEEGWSSAQSAAPVMRNLTVMKEITPAGYDGRGTASCTASCMPPAYEGLGKTRWKWLFSSSRE